MLNVSPTQPAAPPRRARLAVIMFFMLHGLLFASWIVRIPDVKAQLGLSDGELFCLRGALSLLCLAALTMLLVGGQVQPHGAAPVASEV